MGRSSSYNVNELESSGEKGEDEVIAEIAPPPHFKSKLHPSHCGESSNVPSWSRITNQTLPRYSIVESIGIATALACNREQDVQSTDFAAIAAPPAAATDSTINPGESRSAMRWWRAMVCGTEGRSEGAEGLFPRPNVPEHARAGAA